MADDRIAIQTLGLTGRLFFELYESVRIFGTYLLWKGLRLFCAAALASSLLLTGCGVTTPLVNPQEQSAPAQITQSQMHNAIIRAAQLRKWRIVSDQPGVVTLAYPGSAKAIHFEAIVKVTYDARRYKVSYVSSRGLDEKKRLRES